MPADFSIGLSAGIFCTEGVNGDKLIGCQGSGK
jgi:hypothetical protein